MSHDDIRAALEAATPGDWSAEALGSEGFAVYAPPREGSRRRQHIARFGWLEWEADKANAHLIASAPTWLAELLAENELLTALTEAMASLVKASTRLVQIDRDDARARAEAAEQAIQRVRDMPATPPSGGYYMVSMRDVLRALDGGAS